MTNAGTLKSANRHSDRILAGTTNDREQQKEGNRQISLSRRTENIEGHANVFSLLFSQAAAHEGT